MTRLFHIPLFLLSAFAFWEIRSNQKCALMVSPSEKVSVPIGGSVDLMCSIPECSGSRYITTAPKWGNDSVVYKSDAITYVETARAALLIFKNVQKTDFKQYWCTANYGGSVLSAAVDLSAGIENSKGCKLEVSPNKVHVRLRDSGQISCRFSGCDLSHGVYERPHWQVSHVSGTGRMTTISTVHSAFLIYTHFDSDDYQEYFCFAKPKKGYQIHGRLNIYKKPCNCHCSCEGSKNTLSKYEWQSVFCKSRNE